MPPNLNRKKKTMKFEELPSYASIGAQLTRPATERGLELEPSPLIEAILSYLDQA